MGARFSHFESPGGQFKYWVTPLVRKGIDSYVIGSTQRGPETLVSLGELNLTRTGHIPKVDTCPATVALSPKQKPPRRVDVARHERTLRFGALHH